MSIIWIILKILISVGILTSIVKMSYNLIFFIGKKPIIWIFVMLVLNFLFFLVFSHIQNSFSVVWWSSFLVFFTILPPKINKHTEKELVDAIDLVYEENGIKNGRLKYKLGLVSYIIGGLIGWIVFYGEFG